MNNKYVITNPDGSIQVMDECNYAKSVLCGFKENTMIEFKERPNYATFVTLVKKSKSINVSYRFEWPGIFEEFESINKQRNF